MPTSQFALENPDTCCFLLRPNMRVLSLAALIALVSAVPCTATSENTGITKIELDAERLTRQLAAAPKQVKRSLRQYRQYDFNVLAKPTSINEERQMGAEKLDDVVNKVDDIVGVTAKIPKNMDDAVKKAAMMTDDVTVAVKKAVAKYPKGLSDATMKQIKEVEELRLNDLATYSKKTGDGMRRNIEPFEGIKIAPEKYLESHVGRGLQRYGKDKSRLLSSAVVSRSAKDGGDDVRVRTRQRTIGSCRKEAGTRVRTSKMQRCVRSSKKEGLKQNCCTTWASSSSKMEIKRTPTTPT